MYYGSMNISVESPLVTDFDAKALEYAERYGVIDYEVTDSVMTYFEVYPTEGTFKAVVDLSTMIEKRYQVA